MIKNLRRKSRKKKRNKQKISKRKLRMFQLVKTKEKRIKMKPSIKSQFNIRYSSFLFDN